MHLSHLKSRILSNTNRSFSESSYGARSFREFVERCTTIVTVVGEGGRIAAQLTESAKERIESEIVGLGWESPEDEIARHREKADHLGVGEILVSSLGDAPDAEIPRIFSRAVSAWASPTSFQMDATSIQEIISRRDEFVPADLALATVHVARRTRISGRAVPSEVNDLVFRVAEEIGETMGLPREKGLSVLVSASAKLDAERGRLLDAVKLFCGSTSVTAKLPSIDVLKAAHTYSPLALTGERPLLRELDVMLGPVFRKFCEACERHESSKLGRRKEELQGHLEKFKSVAKNYSRSELVRRVLAPVAVHVDELIAEGLRREEAFTQPALSIVEPNIKVDLNAGATGTSFSARLRNSGQGVALKIEQSSPDGIEAADLMLTEPSSPFDLAPGADQIVKFRLRVDPGKKSLIIPVTWLCEARSGKDYAFEDQIGLGQQQTEPDWEALERSPPYGINPIKNRSDLYGRDSVLEDLTLCGLAGDSTFLWGQKRVGKTSILQVLEQELSPKAGVCCTFLRMGELAALHEGEIAHTIAERLNTQVAKPIVVPPSANFGAGMGKLVPLVSELVSNNIGQRLIVIIDEFDDIDSSFYVGERGKQFVKALRSLSEVGLTFFFAGSERMDSIYSWHAEDLNKWTNIALDRIESREDCKALVIEPVRGVLEFEEEAVNSIVDYCRGNPFYMHLLCGEIFRQCWKERRTFVGATHVDLARQVLLVKLAPTNFAHLWEDNPELDHAKKREQAAENCLILACVSSLGGKYEAEREVAEAQGSMGLGENERMTLPRVRSVIQRLHRRKVLCQSRRESAIGEISLPVFEEWLSSNAEAHLLDRWRNFCEEREAARHKKRPSKKSEPIDDQFPIHEDELLAVTADLVYLGRQKDVAEVRRWLRQFDDDNRIEIAFLLLKRLASKGFVNDGSIANGLSKMHDAIQAARLEVGKGAWRIVRNRSDNLCITFVDSEVKSGGVIARELAKRVRPGKCGPLDQSEAWVRTHLDQDPILLVVDDFTASGDTLVRGLKKATENAESSFSQLVSEGRVLCCVLTAFPEAIERIKSAYPTIPVLAMRVFGDEHRALDADAGIFEDASSRIFAKEMLLQLGRELTPQMPLGYSDMAALVAFHNTVPNNTLPIFWCSGTVNGKPWHALLPRA